MNVWQFITLIAALNAVINTSPHNVFGNILVLICVASQVLAAAHIIVTKGWRN